MEFLAFHVRREWPAQKGAVTREGAFCRRYTQARQTLNREGRGYRMKDTGTAVLSNSSRTITPFLRTGESTITPSGCENAVLSVWYFNVAEAGRITSMGS